MTRQDQIKAYLLIAIFLVAGIIFFGCAGGGSSAPTYAPSSSGESTEDMMRRVYDDQGIDYDEQMLKEDAAAVDQLYREFGDSM